MSTPTHPAPLNHRQAAAADNNFNDADLSICRIGPWNSKAEFQRVYALLFGPTASAASRRQACDWLRVWKIRRQHLTPAAVLSTLTILEVQQQAADDGASTLAEEQLRQLYAHSFTRFLNYMSSILQTRNMKSMYSTAQELGLESFLVDLRHLCAHGHDLPALDVFERSAAYLLDWLHRFYWLREAEHISDAQHADVRPRGATEFEAYADSLLEVYDTCTEAAYRRCRYLADIKNGKPWPDESVAWSLKKYGAYHQLDKLTAIAQRVSAELAELAARESRVRGNARLFCEALLRCKWFVASAAEAQAKEQSLTDAGEQLPLRPVGTDLVGLHQNLFRSLAVCGFVETFLQAAIAIAEDAHATLERRRGAQFWATRVVEGFVVFGQAKRAFQRRKERNAAFEADLAPVCVDGVMTPELRELYGRLGVNCAGVLMFGDTVRRPWTLTLTRQYLNERAVAVSEFTHALVVKCMGLVEPALEAEEAERLQALMAAVAAVADAAADGADALGTQQSDSTVDEVFAVDEQTLEVKRVETTALQSAEMAVEDGGAGEVLAKWGVWSEVSDDYNWKTVPLGRVPWE